MALFNAIKNGNYGLVKHLLDSGADPNSRSKAGHFYYKSTALLDAIYNDKLKVACLLLDRGANVNSTGALGFSPLHIAARRGNMKIAKLLLNQGACINSKNINGYTPLFNAVSSGNVPLIYLLLDYGADPMMKDKWNRRASGHVRRGRNTKIRTLLKSAETAWESWTPETSCLLPKRRRLEIVGALSALKYRPNRNLPYLPRELQYEVLRYE